MVTPQTHPIVGKIRDGLALSLHAQAWADAADEAAQQGQERLYPPQAQILDYCGKPTAQANYMAAKIIGQLETLNHESIILTLQRASQADGFEIGSYPHASEEEEYAFDFGFALGLMVTGSGASWSDDHAEFELRKQYIEFYYDEVPAAEALAE
jgi:hypothetical protein